MSKDLDLSLAEMFRDATMQSVMIELRTPEDWDRFNSIKKAMESRENDEFDRFDSERPDLLSKAREKLLREAGEFTHDYPPPFGMDRFDKTILEDRALALIEHDHEGRLLQIKTEETDAYNALRDDIHARENTRSVARDNFTRATDRRSGEDRRMPTRDR